jgi:pimeloyl-ACP methyl ester carboxylesterase
MRNATIALARFILALAPIACASSSALAGAPERSSGGLSGAGDDAATADARAFRQIFLREVRSQRPATSEDEVRATHFLPDAAVARALRATTLGAAMDAVRASSIPSLVEASQRPESAIALDPVRAIPAQRKPLTIVLVPGVFAEFIENRAFEEVFEKPSAFRESFAQAVASRKAAGDDSATDRVAHLRDLKSPRPAAEIAAESARDLNQLIHVGEIAAGAATVRVILFYTEFGTLESLGRNEPMARLYRARLQKYLKLTGAQSLALVGYSRGAPLALEMLAQAKAESDPWLADVKAVVSLSGVVLGSSLADGAMDEASQSPMHRFLGDLKGLPGSLRYLPDPAKGLFGDSNREVAWDNVRKWSAFFAQSKTEFDEMNRDKPDFSTVNPLSAFLQLDPRMPFSIVLRMWHELGLDAFSAEYNENIDRFGSFIEKFLAATGELTTASRTAWWAKNDIPLGPTYYSIAASMANPEAKNAIELPLFRNPLSYGGDGNFDDIYLLRSSLDYFNLTKAEPGGPGVSLNDSQVSVAQASFIPGIIGELRPANAGIKAKFLGIAGTHHWGMALRTVNKDLFYPDRERNGFPREAMLRALATQILLDRP